MLKSFHNIFFRSLSKTLPLNYSIPSFSFKSTFLNPKSFFTTTLNPENDEIIYSNIHESLLQAIITLHDSQFTKSIRLFSSSLDQAKKLSTELDPELIILHIGLAESYVALNSPHLALIILKEAESLLPKVDKLMAKKYFNILGRTYCQMGNLISAETSLDNAEQLLGQCEASEGVNHEKISLLVDQAILKIAQKDYVEAFKDLEETRFVLSFTEEEGEADLGNERSRLYLAYGDMYKGTNDLKSAMDCYKKNLKLLLSDNGNENSFYICLTYREMALLAAIKGEREAASQYFKQALKIGELDCGEESNVYVNILIDYADFCNHLEYYHKAIEYYQKCLEILRSLDETEPKILEIYQKLTPCFIKNGQFKEGLSHLLDEEVLLAKNYPNGDKNFRDLYSKLALTYLTLGQSKKALEFSQKLHEIIKKNKLDREETSVSDFQTLSDIYIDLNEYQNALNAIQSALKIIEKSENPDNQLKWELHVSQGDILNKLARPNEALDFYRKAHKLEGKILNHKPKGRNVDYEIGLLLSKVGKHNEALDYFEKALEYQEERNEDQSNLWRIYKEIGAQFKKIKEPEEAIFAYKAAIELIDNNKNDGSAKAELYHEIGEIYQKLGRLREAKESFENASLELFHS